jgi:hypothetical protein
MRDLMEYRQVTELATTGAHGGTPLQSIRRNTFGGLLEHFHFNHFTDELEGFRKRNGDLTALFLSFTVFVGKVSHRIAR